MSSPKYKVAQLMGEVKVTPANPGIITLPAGARHAAASLQSVVLYAVHARTKERLAEVPVYQRSADQLVVRIFGPRGAKHSGIVHYSIVMRVPVTLQSGEQHA